MNAALARRPASSFYSAVLLALIGLSLAMQASFLAGLAGRGTASPPPALVQKGPQQPCVNG